MRGRSSTEHSPNGVRKPSRSEVEREAAESLWWRAANERASTRGSNIERKAGAISVRKTMKLEGFTSMASGPGLVSTSPS
jgi:hypothetical protein